ncbi:MAG: hypothetical protein CMI60_07910 [Parvibaculum sp.]|nr:hypothetical protein [Parvibaculum sp.]|tara:strand:+ start:521 stop:703 length:183 start_codon:yes stop_codon:yes gene_type:complete
MSLADRIMPKRAKELLSDDELNYILMIISESTFSGKDVLVVSEIVNKIKIKLDEKPTNNR